MLDENDNALGGMRTVWVDAPIKTWYAHMQPKRPVSVGQWVKKGQIVGYEGNTGHATGAHLHWMVELNGTFVNPQLFV